MREGRKVDQTSPTYAQSAQPYRHAPLCWQRGRRLKALLRCASSTTNRSRLELQKRRELWTDILCLMYSKLIGSKSVCSCESS